MKKYWNIIAFVALALTLASGCKKNEDETKEYLIGNVTFDFPAYVQPGFSRTYDLKPMMVLSRPDGGKEIGYYYTNPKTGARDTVVTSEGRILRDSFTIEVPDTLATLNVSFGGFAGDDLYYGRTASKTFTVVKPGLNNGASITNFVYYSASDKSFTDSRDSKEYLYVTVGGVDWMRQNLAWEGAGTAFQESDATTDVFGRYYSWTEAKTACPEGWTVPSEADFVALAKTLGVNDAKVNTDIAGLAGLLMGDLHFNGKKMWEYWPAVKISDKSHLSIMPAGYSMGTSKREFKGIYTYASIMTADEYEGNGIIRYIYHDRDIVYAGTVSKTDFASPLRCIRK